MTVTVPLDKQTPRPQPGPGFPLCPAWRRWQKRSHHTSPSRWKYRG